MVTPSFHLLKLKTLDGPRCLLVPQTPCSTEQKVLLASALDSLGGSASPPLPWSRPHSLSLELLNSLSRIFPDSAFVPPAQSILKTTRESLLKHQSDKATLVQLCLHPSLSKMAASGIHLHPCPPNFSDLIPHHFPPTLSTPASLASFLFSVLSTCLQLRALESNRYPICSPPCLLSSS